jgi:hypothetical protein
VSLIVGLLSLTMAIVWPAAAILPQATARVAGPVPTGDPRFGIHPSPGGGDSPPVGVFGVERLWDTGVIWCRMNPQPGVWDFTALTTQLSEAARRGARDVIVVLGFPPPHALADMPSASLRYGREAPWICPTTGYASILPNDAVWQEYIQRTAEQVRAWQGQHAQTAVHFQVWNEPAVPWFLRPDQSPERMVELAAQARETLRATLPGALLLSPSIVTNSTEAKKQWQAAFVEAARRWSSRGDPLFDVWATHLYPVGRTFEQVWSGYLADRSDVMATIAPGRLPGDRVWITEINANIAFTAPPREVLSDADQARFVQSVAADTLNRGVGLVVWYRWNYDPWQVGHGQIVLSRQTSAMGSWPQP